MNGGIRLDIDVSLVADVVILQDKIYRVQAHDTETALSVHTTGVSLPIDETYTSLGLESARVHFTRS